MTTDERIAYLRHTLRRSPEGSARHIWAKAQLAQLIGTPPPPTPKHPKRGPK
jgi:hypothetical protein